MMTTTAPVFLCSGGILNEERLTIRQDIKPLLTLREVLDRLLDSREISQINVQELQAPIGAWVSLLDLLDRGVCFALRASSYVDSAIVLVEDLT
jgi:hypothetical protein